jgi:hypothetical protein
MMLLALAGNMGGRGASGFAALAGEPAAGLTKLPPKADRLMRQESAALPMPNPACRKKCRRVTAFRKSLVRFTITFLRLSLSGSAHLRF